MHTVAMKNSTHKVKATTKAKAKYSALKCLLLLLYTVFQEDYQVYLA